VVSLLLNSRLKHQGAVHSKVLMDTAKNIKLLMDRGADKDSLRQMESSQTADQTLLMSAAWLQYRE